jgi:hypothetical protein
MAPQCCHQQTRSQRSSRASRLKYPAHRRARKRTRFVCRKTHMGQHRAAPPPAVASSSAAPHASPPAAWCARRTGASAGRCCGFRPRRAGPAARGSRCAPNEPGAWHGRVRCRQRRVGALHLLRSACAQTARVSAGQAALERERSRLAVAGPAARPSESALADVLLRSRAAPTSGGCCSKSAAHHGNNGHIHARRAPAAALRSRARCSSARAQTQTNDVALLRVPARRSRCACADSCDTPTT